MQQAELLAPYPQLLNDVFGLGSLTDEQAAAMAAQLAPTVTVSTLADILRPMDKPDRDKLVAALIAAGANASTVASALDFVTISQSSAMSVRISPAWAALSLVSGAVSTYHGYKRNKSVGWALWWGFMGSLFPVVTPVIAVAQGFGKPER